MPLEVGNQAPNFTLDSTAGSKFNLSAELSGNPIIVYFYPKDFSPSCTTEACEFRDSFDFFKNLDVKVVGISRDDIATHHKFRKAHQLPFHLLADTTGAVADAYKASIPLIKFTRRVTYLIDAKQKVVAVYENLIGARKHIIEMVAQLKQAKK